MKVELETDLFPETGQLLKQVTYLKAEIEELRREKADLAAAELKMRSAFERCKSFDVGLHGSSVALRSVFRTTCGLPFQLFKLFCDLIPIAEIQQSRLGSWEEDAFLVLHHLRTGLSLHLMQSDYMQEESTLSKRYRGTVELLAKTLSSRFRENAMRDFRPEDLLRHTPAKWKSTFPQYEYVVVVDVTMVYVPKSGDRILNRASLSHYKHASCLGMIRLTALDGYVLCNGRFESGAEPSGFSNLDEMLWIHANLTNLLVEWAKRHEIKLWVAGDKAYGEFRHETLSPSAPVKFLVTGKKGQFAVKTQTARTKQKLAEKKSDRKSKPHVRREVVLVPSAFDNYVYMPQSAFRRARGKIENEFAKFKDWLRFSHKLEAQSIYLVDSEAVIISACENLLIDNRLL